MHIWPSVIGRPISCLGLLCLDTLVCPLVLGPALADLGQPWQDAVILLGVDIASKTLEMTPHLMAFRLVVVSGVVFFFCVGAE